MASLSLHIHKLSTDPRIPDWIVDPKNDSLDQWQAWRSTREENNWQDFKDHLQQRYLD